jgi:hypothetical protein
MDDVNALVPAIRSMLREALVEFAVDVVIGKGSLARTPRMTCHRFTLVGGGPSRRALTSEAVWDGASHLEGRGCGPPEVGQGEGTVCLPPRRTQPPQAQRAASTVLPTLPEATLM